MSTFAITPASGFPPATSDSFPRFLQFQDNGVNIGDTTVETINVTGDAVLTLSSDGGTLTINVTGSDTSGFAVLVGGNVFVDSQTVTPVALTDAAVIDVDAHLSNHFTVTLGGNRTLANPTNLQDGEILNFKIKQDGTGSRTLAYGSKFKWTGGTPPTLTTTAGAVDYISAHYFADDDILVCGSILNLA